MTGYEALRTGVAWLDLSARGKIRVTGEDRARLLHAMSTNHVEGLASSKGLYAFFLNEKGRILADANIYNLGDALLLDTEPELRPKLIEHLDRFIIADDVLLEDQTESWAAIGLEGPQSIALAERLQIAAGEAEFDTAIFGDGFTVRVSGNGIEGIRIFVPADHKQDLVHKLEAAGAIASSAEEARTVRIENGLPRYGEEIGDRFLVQETQIQRAVHTNKGCYVGQEIVERVRSQGQVRRLLTPFHISCSLVPAAGTKILGDDVEVGEIVSAVWSPALGKVAGLAYLRQEAAKTAGATVVAGSEPPVRVEFSTSDSGAKR